jgi:NAD(P)-dependent dehydrogenase (short-subunit alcohol dehydrogenase family)
MATPPTFDLQDRVALVTGASRGIGESIARLLAAHGARVIVASRKIDDCETVAASIRDAGGKARALACHIGDLDAIDAAFANLKSTEGRLDILVNNAATNPYFGSILDTDPAAFQKTVDVNLRGYFFMCARGAKLMAASGGGAIVNVASINAVVPGAMQGIYSITKAGVVSMTKAFAKECAPIGVRVNALLPGATDTKFAACDHPQPRLRRAQIDDVARADGSCRIPRRDGRRGALPRVARREPRGRRRFPHRVALPEPNHPRRSN